MGGRGWPHEQDLRVVVCSRRDVFILFLLRGREHSTVSLIRKRKHVGILKLPEPCNVGSMTTEIVLQHSILDSLHTHRPLPSNVSLEAFLVSCAQTVCCITFLYTRSFSHLSLPRLVKQPGIIINTTYTSFATANFLQAYLCKFSHMTTHGMWFATQRS